MERDRRCLLPKNDGWVDVDYEFGRNPEDNARISAILNEACHVLRCHAGGTWAASDKDAYASKPRNLPLAQASSAGCSAPMIASRGRSSTGPSSSSAQRPVKGGNSARTRQELRAKKLGVEARRRVVLGNFIADFLVPSVRLVIEVDGGSHRARAAADARRDRKLGKLGHRVLRLDAELVLGSLPEALARARQALGR